MCNDYRWRLPTERLIEEFSHIRIAAHFPQGAPNIEPREDIRIKDRAPTVRWRDGAAQLEQMTWAWSGPTGKPVFNFRSDGRRFAPGDRVLIPADGFYEFTAGQGRLKDKHLFTMRGHDLFAIAGIVRNGAWTMLTTEPGPDMAPYHDRQIVVLAPDRWGDWLRATVPEADILRPAPAGTFDVQTVRAA